MKNGTRMHRRRVSEESGSSSSGGNRTTMSNNRSSLLPPLGVATTARMNEQEQARMRTAYALIDEARDMEQETLAHQQHGHNAAMKEEEDANTSCYQQHIFQKQQQRTRIELYQEALAIMESLVGVYHPDVANTYHLFGWSFLLYHDNDTNDGRYHHPEQSATTSAHIISALIYFLKALRITHRLFGKDHPSTCVLLDDIRDIVRGSSTACSNDNDDDNDVTHSTSSSSSSSTTRRRLLETQCTQILDSWHYQNLAEAAILVHKDAVAALHWYHCALNLLPTTSIAEPSINSAHNSENSNNRRPEISTVVVVIDDDDPTDTKEEGTTSLLSSNEDTECSNNRHDGSEWTGSLDDDDDAMTIGVEDYNYHYDTSGTGIGLADLERATIQFQMARLLPQPPEHPLTSPRIKNHHDDGQYGLSLSSFDLYCRALAVLPLWLSEQNQMVIQARHDIASYSI